MDFRLVPHRGWREKYLHLLSRAAEKFPELPRTQRGLGSSRPKMSVQAPFSAKNRATRATFWSVRLGKINISSQLAGRERPKEAIEVLQPLQDVA